MALELLEGERPYDMTTEYQAGRQLQQVVMQLVLQPRTLLLMEVPWHHANKAG